MPMCATTIAVVVDSRATAYSRIMQWLHRIGEAIDSLVAWWRRSLIGRVIDRYVSRRGPLLANGLAYGLLFAFFAGVWIVVSALGLVVTGSEEMQKALLAMLRTVIPSVSDSLPGALLLESTGFATGVLLNFALFMLLLRVVAHIRAGKFTLVGAALGALAVAVMQLLGARLLTGASRNPMLAPFAAIIGVLIWFNLVAQVIMICAAFIAECRRGAGRAGASYIRCQPTG